MKVKFGDDQLDLDTINSVGDVASLMENIKGQKKALFKDKTTIPKGYILFDECTEKEIALRNLAYLIKKDYDAMRSKMFPASIANIAFLARQQNQKDLINIPPVDFEAYANLQKLSYLHSYIQQYALLLIQTRIGFGLNLIIANGNKIYCLKDLRDLYSS